jgi:hypothetical protein
MAEGNTFTIRFREGADLVVQATGVGWTAGQGSAGVIYLDLGGTRVGVFPSDAVQAVYKTDAAQQK